MTSDNEFDSSFKDRIDQTTDAIEAIVTDTPNEWVECEGLYDDVVVRNGRRTTRNEFWQAYLTLTRQFVIMSNRRQDGIRECKYISEDRRQWCFRQIERAWRKIGARIFDEEFGQASSTITENLQNIADPIGLTVDYVDKKHPCWSIYKDQIKMADQISGYGTAIAFLQGYSFGYSGRAADMQGAKTSDHYSVFDNQSPGIVIQSPWYSRDKD